jgi:hypothetical protein
VERELIEMMQVSISSRSTSREPGARRPEMMPCRK